LRKVNYSEISHKKRKSKRDFHRKLKNWRAEIVFRFSFPVLFRRLSYFRFLSFCTYLNVSVCVLNINCMHVCSNSSATSRIFWKKEQRNTQIRQSQPEPNPTCPTLLLAAACFRNKDKRILSEVAAPQQ